MKELIKILLTAGKLANESETGDIFDSLRQSVSATKEQGMSLVSLQTIQTTGFLQRCPARLEFSVAMSFWGTVVHLCTQAVQ